MGEVDVEIGKADFDFYSRFVKPLILTLNNTEDRILASAWFTKLKDEASGPEKLRLDYLKLLLFVLQRHRLVGPFVENPNINETLEDFGEENYDLASIARKIIEKEQQEKKEKYLKKIRGEMGDFPPFITDLSPDLKEYVAAQDIPNFGVHVYYAISKDPILNWDNAEHAIFPKTVRKMEPHGHLSETSFAVFEPRPETPEEDDACAVLDETGVMPEESTFLSRKSKQRKSPFADMERPVPLLGILPGEGNADEIQEPGITEELPPPTWGSNLIEVNEPLVPEGPETLPEEEEEEKLSPEDEEKLAKLDQEIAELLENSFNMEDIMAEVDAVETVEDDFEDTIDPEAVKVDDEFDEMQELMDKHDAYLNSLINELDEDERRMLEEEELAEKSEKAVTIKEPSPKKELKVVADDDTVIKVLVDTQETKEEKRRIEAKAEDDKKKKPPGRTGLKVEKAKGALLKPSEKKALEAEDKKAKVAATKTGKPRPGILAKPKTPRIAVSGSASTSKLPAKPTGLPKRRGFRSPLFASTPKQAPLSPAPPAPPELSRLLILETSLEEKKEDVKEMFPDSFYEEEADKSARKTYTERRSIRRSARKAAMSPIQEISLEISSDAPNAPESDKLYNKLKESETLERLFQLQGQIAPEKDKSLEEFETMEKLYDLYDQAGIDPAEQMLTSPPIFSSDMEMRKMGRHVKYRPQEFGLTDEELFVSGEDYFGERALRPIKKLPVPPTPAPLPSEVAESEAARRELDRLYQLYGQTGTPPIFSKRPEIQQAGLKLRYSRADFGVGDEEEFVSGPEFFEEDVYVPYRDERRELAKARAQEEKEPPYTSIEELKQIAERADRQIETSPAMKSGIGVTTPKTPTSPRRIRKNLFKAFQEESPPPYESPPPSPPKMDTPDFVRVKSYNLPVFGEMDDAMKMEHEERERKRHQYMQEQIAEENLQVALEYPEVMKIKDEEELAEFELLEKSLGGALGEEGEPTGPVAIADPSSYVTPPRKIPHRLPLMAPPSVGRPPGTPEGLPPNMRYQYFTPFWYKIGTPPKWSSPEFPPYDPLDTEDVVYQLQPELVEADMDEFEHPPGSPQFELKEWHDPLQEIADRAAEVPLVAEEDMAPELAPFEDEEEMLMRMAIIDQRNVEYLKAIAAQAEEGGEEIALLEEEEPPDLLLESPYRPERPKRPALPPPGSPDIDPRALRSELRAHRKDYPKEKWEVFQAGTRWIRRHPLKSEIEVIPESRATRPHELVGKYRPKDPLDSPPSMLVTPDFVRNKLYGLPELVTKEQLDEMIRAKRSEYDAYIRSEMEAEQELMAKRLELEEFEEMEKVAKAEAEAEEAGEARALPGPFAITGPSSYATPKRKIPFRRPMVTPPSVGKVPGTPEGLPPNMRYQYFTPFWYKYETPPKWSSPEFPSFDPLDAEDVIYQMPPDLVEADLEGMEMAEGSPQFQLTAWRNLTAEMAERQPIDIGLDLPEDMAPELVPFEDEEEKFLRLTATDEGKLEYFKSIVEETEKEGDRTILEEELTPELGSPYTTPERAPSPELMKTPPPAVPAIPMRPVTPESPEIDQEALRRELVAHKKAEYTKIAEGGFKAGTRWLPIFSTRNYMYEPLREHVELDRRMAAGPSMRDHYRLLSRKLPPLPRAAGPLPSELIGEEYPLHYYEDTLMDRPISPERRLQEPIKPDYEFHGYQTPPHLRKKVIEEILNRKHDDDRREWRADEYRRFAPSSLIFEEPPEGIFMPTLDEIVDTVVPPRLQGDRLVSPPRRPLLALPAPPTPPTAAQPVQSPRRPVRQLPLRPAIPVSPDMEPEALRQDLRAHKIEYPLSLEGGYAAGIRWVPRFTPVPKIETIEEDVTPPRRPSPPKKPHFSPQPGPSYMPHVFPYAPPLSPVKTPQRTPPAFAIYEDEGPPSAPAVQREQPSFAVFEDEEPEPSKVLRRVKEVSFSSQTVDPEHPDETNKVIKGKTVLQFNRPAESAQPVMTPASQGVAVYPRGPPISAVDVQAGAPGIALSPEQRVVRRGRGRGRRRVGDEGGSPKTSSPRRLLPRRRLFDESAGPRVQHRDIFTVPYEKLAACPGVQLERAPIEIEQDFEEIEHDVIPEHLRGFKWMDEPDQGFLRAFKRQF